MGTERLVSSSMFNVCIQLLFLTWKVHVDLTTLGSLRAGSASPAVSEGLQCISHLRSLKDEMSGDTIK